MQQQESVLTRAVPCRCMCTPVSVQHAHLPVRSTAVGARVRENSHSRAVPMENVWRMRRDVGGTLWSDSL